MKSFEKVILERASDGKTVLVFPSEVSAWFWRRHTLDETGASTVRTDRFLSWDRFKERLTVDSKDTRPANRAFRMIFASLFLEKVALGQQRLDSLVPFGYRWNARSFTSWLSRMLPGLQRLRQAVETVPVEGLEGARKDVILLHEEYRGFLVRNGYFEPSWEKAPENFDTGNTCYTICFPEVLEDYGEYENALTGEAFEILKTEEGPPSARVLRFETTLEEMDWVLSQAAAYLDEGMRPGDMVISLPDGDEWRYLEEEAPLYGVPLDLRRGKTLTDYRGASFFQLLTEALEENLSLSSLEGLFLNRAFPWKNRGTWEDLIRFGRERGILKNPGRRNLWREKLLAQGKKELWENLDALISAVRRCMDAESFTDLRVRIYAFIDRFLDPEGWSDVDRQVFRYSLDSLGDLLRLEESLKDQGTLQPCRLWLSYLASGPYVPRGGKAGIPVFPYGVSAGIMPPVHFIVGADQGRIGKVSSIPAFLREDQRSACGLAEEDRTDAFLSLYTRSGKEVWISFSAQGFDGPGLTPSFFLERSEALTLSSPPAGFHGSHYRDQAYWAGESPLPEPLAPPVTEGLETLAVTAFRGDGGTFDFIQRPETARRLEALKKNDRGETVISPTGLDAFLSCRFSYLLSHLLGLEETASEVQIPDPRERGIFLHEVLKLFMETLRQRGEAFSAGKTKEYLHLSREVLSRTARNWEKAGRDFFGPAWKVHLRWAEECLEAFLAAEGELFDGYSPRLLEESLSRRSERLPIVLSGRIDRLSASQEASVLVDYKTHQRYKKNEFAPEEAPSLQLPLYAWIVDNDKPPLGCAAYYDITAGSYTRLFDLRGGGWLDEEAFRSLVSLVPVRAAEMAEALKTGNYTFRSDETCEGCAFRMVCRERFTLRFAEKKTGGADE